MRGMLHVRSRFRDRWAVGALVTVMLGGALLSACGANEPDAGEEPSGSTGSAAPETADLPDWPACAEVWVAESELSPEYRGCLDDEVGVAAEKQRCSSGQVLVTYADRFYAVMGGPVNETEGLAEDSAYQRARDACVA